MKRLFARRPIGFTLIELMVVIVIIGILASMLFPVLFKSREKARSARCKGNLKQLQIAAMNYALDHDGALPHARSYEWYDATNDVWYEEVGWVAWLNWESHSGTSRNPGDLGPWWGDTGLQSITNGALWEYTGESLKMYLCPTFKIEDTIGGDDPTGSDFDGGNPVLRGYVMSGRIVNMNMMGLLNASKLMLFADMSVTNRLDGVTIAAYYARQSEVAGRINTATAEHAWDGQLDGRQVSGQNYPYESIGVHHEGKGNVIFMDGHIESVTWDQTIPLWQGNL